MRSASCRGHCAWYVDKIHRNFRRRIHYASFRPLRFALALVPLLVVITLTPAFATDVPDLRTRTTEAQLYKSRSAAAVKVDGYPTFGAKLHKTANGYVAANCPVCFGNQIGKRKAFIELVFL